MRPIPVPPVDANRQQAATLEDLSLRERDQQLHRRRRRRQREPSPMLETPAQIYQAHREWFASLAVHLLLLLVLWAIKATLDESNAIEILGAVSPLTPEELELDSPAIEWDLTRPVDLASVQSPLISLAGQEGELASAMDIEIDAPEMPLDATFQAPQTPLTEIAELMAAADELLSAEVGRTAESVRGAVVNAGGDAGAVDHLTMEILRRLERNDLLVAWVLDASGSLRARREQVIQRFTRIYDELDVLAEDRGDRLLTAVVAFGQAPQELTRPTADRQQLQQAVEAMQADDSGVENVFTAVGKTAQLYVKHQTAERDLMLVVLTDEMGDDPLLLEPALQLLARQQIPVYVIGPIAPFGRQQIEVQWTDESSGEKFQLPVQRGPEAAVVESARMIRWDPDQSPDPDLLSSGFGPYALTRLAHNSGGVYYLFDDGSLPGPQFPIEALLDYSPSYGSLNEYAAAVSKQQLRAALVSTSQAINKSLPQPQTKFLAAGIQFEVRDTRETLTKALLLLERSLSTLRSVAEQLQDEESSRWRAHYDLLAGRAAAHQLRCLAALPLLEEMFREPQAPQDVTKNAWKLAGDPATAMSAWPDLDSVESAESQPDAEPAKGAEGAPADPETQWLEQARRTKKLLQGVVEQHPDTPWAQLAQHELDTPLKFLWKEDLVPPPAGEKMPWDKVPWDTLTEEQKQFVTGYRERQRKRAQRKEVREEAKQRVPKL